MQKKILIQISLLLLVFLIIFITFNKYFNNSPKFSSINQQNDGQKINNKNQNNLMKEIYYVSSDSANNVYEIMSEIGEIDTKNQSIIMMTDVTAKITFSNSEPVNITSKYAKYNNENYETTFTKDVLVKFIDHEIKAESMELSMEKNLATMSKDIFYNNSDIELIADKVEIDLLTKNSKIFMDNKYKKVEITGKAKNGNY
jgi:lipopolysaccharide export system protein LptA